MIVFGHIFGGERIIVHPHSVSTSANLCDAVKDSIKISLKLNILNLSIAGDNFEYEIMFEESWQLQNADIYIGSVPGMFC